MKYLHQVVFLASPDIAKVYPLLLVSINFERKHDRAFIIR